MNNLKFIDEEIKFCQAKINKTRQDIIYQQTMLLLMPENNNIDFALLNNFHISLNETKIKYLKQIKTELEDLEILKSKLYLPEENDCDTLDDGSKVYMIYAKGVLSEEEYKAVKEVLNEKSN